MRSDAIASLINSKINPTPGDYIAVQKQMYPKLRGIAPRSKKFSLKVKGEMVPPWMKGLITESTQFSMRNYMETIQF